MQPKMFNFLCCDIEPKEQLSLKIMIGDIEQMNKDIAMMDKGEQDGKHRDTKKDNGIY